MLGSKNVIGISIFNKYCSTARKLHKMKAWQMHSYGDLKELQLSTTRIPLITNPNSLLIKVNAASINPIDLAMIHGYGRTIFGLFRESELEFPTTLGRDFSGTVVSKGHNVGDKFEIGDNVYGVIPLHKQGSHAEYVMADAAHVLLQPQHLSAIEAGSILYAAMTAWSALYITGEFKSAPPHPSKILILGASGGVGTVATQILKADNAIVVGTCSSNAVPLVSSLGADHVFDYTSPDYIQNVASQGKYDIILDCAKFGYENVPKNWKYDKYVTLNSPLLTNTDRYGLAAGLATSLKDLLVANATFLCDKAVAVRWGFFIPSSNGLHFINKLVTNKQIIPTIHKTFKFDETLKGFEALAAGHLRGKVVIDMQSS